MTTRIVRLLAGGAAACTLALATVADAGLAQGGGGSQPPESGTPAWLRARLENRLDARTRIAVERVIDSARAAGAPAEPLVSKALQGAAMRASGDRIVAAVQQLAHRLTVARGVLGETALTSELDAAAEALRAGVSVDALRKLRTDRPGQQLTVALGVLADLISGGVPPEVATSSVLALTKAGMADEQLVAFRREVERDIGIGAPPAAAAILRGTSPSLVITGGSGGTRPSGPVKQRP
jgi:hypothetical protein